MSDMVVCCRSMEGTKSRMQAISSGASVGKPVVMMDDHCKSLLVESLGGSQWRRTTDKESRFTAFLWLTKIPDE